MRFLFGLLLLTLSGLGSSAALAQAEYFLNGEAVAGGAVSGVRGGDQNGLGAEVNMMGNARLGVAFIYTYSEVAREFSDPVEISTWNFGFQGYPGRQGVDGPVTVGLALGIGRLSRVDATTLNVGVQVARVVGGSEIGILLTPNADVALALALSEAGAAAVQTVGVGLGIGFVIAPEAVVIIEPSAAFALNEEISEFVVGGTFGLGFRF